MAVALESVAVGGWWTQMSLGWRWRWTVHSRQKEACAQRLIVCKVRHLYRGRGSISWEMGGTHIILGLGRTLCGQLECGLHSITYRQLFLRRRMPGSELCLGRLSHFLISGHDSERESIGMWKDWLGGDSVSPGTGVFWAELSIPPIHLLKFEPPGPQNGTIWI